jgi:hypothetical protein
MPFVPNFDGLLVIKALCFFFIKKERYLCTTDESVVTILMLLF